jgi:pyridoxal phosphate enzyme (YggS family)
MTQVVESRADVSANLAAIKERIRAAERAAGRGQGSVTLVAVTKTHDAERIIPALEGGHRVFGENRVQEAGAKWPDLRGHYPDIQLHLIGPLQTNKVAQAVALFDAIQTVDRDKLARALGAEQAKTGLRRRYFIQVNTGEEPQKAGVAPGEADRFVATCRDTHGLDVVGLMCIPPVDEEPALHFALLAKIAARNGLNGLSMGMSGDFETAVRLGATHVRVGTAIFGVREAAG